MGSAVNPDILDVVPWSYGFAHSWTLRWLLGDKTLAPLVLSAIEPLALAGARRVEELRAEGRVGRSRADLTFRTFASDGEPIEVAVETKVSDPVRPKQIQDYEESHHQAVLYLPALTGFLIEENPRIGSEARLTGRALRARLESARLPPLIEKYFAEVEVKSAAFDAALAARGALGADLSGSEHQALLDVAWLRLVVSALRQTGTDLGRSSLRDERSDRGLFWYDAARPAPGAGENAEFYIDVLAPKQAQRRVVAIKGGWNTNVLPELFRLAQERERPGPPGDWNLARRRFAGATMTIWSADVTALDPAEAAPVALAAKRWIDSVTAPT